MLVNTALRSKDANNRALGTKFYSIHGIWALKPYHLGPWTLRAGFRDLGLIGFRDWVVLVVIS